MLSFSSQRIKNLDRVERRWQNRKYLDRMARLSWKGVAPDIAQTGRPEEQPDDDDQEEAAAHAPPEDFSISDEDFDKKNRRPDVA